MENIFKSYDVRGIYPTEINEELVYAIGRAYVQYLDAKTVVIGRDIRESSPQLFASLINGIMDQGADIIDIGEVSTPMVYFASHLLGTDGAIVLTASHNPKEYNGLKFCRENAIPIGLSSGLAQIRDIVLEGNFNEPSGKGTLKTEDISQKYYEKFQAFESFGSTHFSVVVDCANAMGIKELPILQALAPKLSLHLMYDEYDPTFPNHEANPLNTETLHDLTKKVVSTGADMGIAYDGDADRIGFVDEEGGIIPMDIITGLVARIILEKEGPHTILYDLRSSRAIPEVIQSNGGTAKECMVGHANIKRQMREEDAIFAGELSGHYYYKENSFAEASTLTAILILNTMAESGKTLKELVQDIQKYHHSGEINSQVADTDHVLETLKKQYHDGKLSTLDGIKISYPDWWFSVRASNTEPLLRLNLEADTKEQLTKRKDELLHIIQGD